MRAASQSEFHQGLPLREPEEEEVEWGIESLAAESRVSVKWEYEECKELAERSEKISGDKEEWMFKSKEGQFAR